VIDALAEHPAFRGWRLLRVPSAEEHANCVRVNERVLVPARFPRVAEFLERPGHTPLALDMSEFRKQDGGPSCLSLRW
jgi:dimethylargininase